MNTQTNINFSIGDQIEHDDLGPGEVVKPQKALQEDDSRYATVRFQNGMILRCRTKNLRLRNFLSKIADEKGRIAIPRSNDGKEQNAFEAWAIENRFSMDQHPLHWLFLDRETNGARRGWKAALEYVERTLAGALPDNCRDRLRFEGKSYPKSGCDVCENGGIAGCPYIDQVPHVPMSGLSLEDVLRQAGPAEIADTIFPRDGSDTKSVTISPKLLQGVGRQDEFTVTLSAWNKRFADALEEIFVNSIRYDMADTDQEPEKAESHAPLQDRLVEIAGCFSAAEVEGWPEALQEGNLDRLRDIWNRRISYARDLAETATVEPPIEPMLSAPARVGATCFGVGVKWSTVIERAQREFQYQSEKLPNAESLRRARDQLFKLSLRGEEIQVHVDGDDVYILPLELSGVESPYFVVHVPAAPEADTRSPSPAHEDADNLEFDALMAKYHEEVWNASVDGGVDYDLAGLDTAKAISRMYRARNGAHTGTDEEGGLAVTQEPKYTVRNGKIVNRETGDPIPDDEPVFIFRARDVHAKGVIDHYACQLGSGNHRSAVTLRSMDFDRFRHNHPERMKEPDTNPSADDRGHYLHLDNTDNQICGDRAGGFDTPDQLIGYCEIHCRSPSPKFSGLQLNGLLALAGNPEGYGYDDMFDPTYWYTPSFEEVDRLCKLARKKQNGDTKDVRA